MFNLLQECSQVRHRLSLIMYFLILNFRRTNHPHPMLYLKGVVGKDLMGILNFLYRGETKVAEQDLNSFLSVAEELKVKVRQPT